MKNFWKKFAEKFAFLQISRAIFFAEKKLKNLENPRLEAEILAAKILQRDRIFLKKNPQKKFSFWQFLTFQKYIFLRKNRRPLAQICGEKIWADLKIFVNKNVLIPRDETEILCQKIVAEKRNFAPRKILDLGTGSGCIAIFLKKNFPAAEIWASDFSPKIFSIARKNADFHCTKINFCHSNFFENLPKNWEIIVANLPYVPNKFFVKPEIFFEPKNAIFAGNDGLDCIRKFAEKIKNEKIFFREIWLEFLPFQKNKIKKIFVNFEIQFFKNICGQIFFAKISPKSKNFK